MYAKQVRLSIGKDFSEFVPYTISFDQLPNLLCSSNVMYSPAQFNNNRRKASNFLGFEDFIVLDFDEGWTQELEDLFNKYIGYKVPTKSHMKDKNGLVCERYRIILLVKNSILLNYKEHKRLYKHIMKDLSLISDTSCVDATRFYYSAPQPLENCVRLKGTEYFPWEKFNYKDIQYASLVKPNTEEVDVSQFKGLDLSYFADLHHSKRYPCPICRLEGYDQKGHHLGFNKDDDYPTCFFEEEHSKILRKLYKQYKYGTIEDKMEDINDMVRQKCTPDLIKVGKYDPKPTNYSDNLLQYYDKALDSLEKEDVLALDIETFSEYYVAETLEEAEARLRADYKYIKGAYNNKCAEYQGVDLDTFKNKVRLITLGGETAVCPFDMYYATEEQKQRILNLVKDKMLVGHNIKFDLKSIMASYGRQYCPSYCFDTMIASRMIHMAQDPEDQQAGHNLEATAFRFLNYKMNKSIEHSWGKDNLDPRQLEYAGTDVKVLLPIYKEQVRQFMELYGPFDTINYDIEELRFLGPLVDKHPILALEMQTLLEVIRIEFDGIRPNIPMMERKIQHYNELIDKADEDLGINCGSSKQCVEYLQKHIDPSITSSAYGVLEQYDYDERVVKIIDGKASRTRRGLMESMSSTYVHPYDNRIHPHFNQLLNTGRFSCSNPNMQQIPKDIKNDLYMSTDSTEDKDGTVIYDTDYAAVELRLVTGVSQDPVLLEAYSKNTDMHYLTASFLFKKQIPKTHEEKEDAEKNPNSPFLNKWQRGFGKTCNFGLIYGLHWTTFVAMATTGKDSKMTEEEAKAHYFKFFETYKGIDNLIKTAENTFMYGTDRYIDRWVRYKNDSLHKLENKQVPFFTVVKTLIGRKLAADTQNKMLNYPVQGSGADAIKLGICKMGYETRKQLSSQKTINLVHDDTIAESMLYDFDFNSQQFRSSLEWSVNYVLRRQFYTPVNQDFCVLSLLGEEVFLEEAFTLEDIDKKLVEKIQEVIENIKKTEDTQEKTDLTVEANRLHKLLQKFRNNVARISKGAEQLS